MSLSLNELESLAKRATWGAGYPWGLAEEAGKGARWLCVYGFDGIGQLASLLQKSLADKPVKHRPVSDVTTQVLQANDQLCPLATGAFLSDNAKNLGTGGCEIHHVANPLLLLPFAANIALLNNQKMTVQCRDSLVSTNGSDVSKNSNTPFSGKEKVVSIRRGGKMSRLVTKQHRATADTLSIQVLTRFADRTYAPATADSRLLGAGAGLQDNN